MGALHFLELEPLPDALRPHTKNEIEVFEMRGELFIKVTLAAPSGNAQAFCQDGTPYTASITASLRVSADQLKRIEHAMAEARSRIGA